MGDVGGGSEKAGCDGERFIDRSDCCDIDREDMGTVRWFMFPLELRGFHSVPRLVGRGGSSGGISSGGGSGRPFTIATS
jgi:hypothetical protein